MLHNVTVQVATVDPQTAAETLLDELADLHPAAAPTEVVLGVEPNGLTWRVVEVVVTIEAATLGCAVVLVEHRVRTSRHGIVGVYAMTTEEHDRRALAR